MSRLYPARLARRLHPARLVQMPHLIRFRLTLWYTGLAAVVLAVFVGSVFYAFSQYQFDSIDQQAEDVLNQTFNQQVTAQFVDRCLSASARARASTYIVDDPASCYGVEFKVKNPNALDTPYSTIQYFSLKNGQPLASGANGHASVPAPLNSKDNSSKAAVSAATKGDHTSAVTKDQYRIITMPLNTQYGTKVIGQIAWRMGRVQSQVDTLKHILVYIAGALLIISAAGGWILSGRVLKPVDEITRRARQITAHDLSQRLNIEQEDELGRMAETFDEMIGRLEEAFERQKRFASDASHELRTPLTVMQADLGLALARPRSPEEYQATLASMDEEVSRLSTIVSDLLTLTRVDVDPAGIQHQPVDLDELLESLAARVNVIAAERDIVVRANTLTPVTVTGDPTRLRQLFTNLLDNAVNYTPDGGRVTVTLERTREGARIRVADTGIGIAPDQLPRIFERFYRTDEAREQNAQGTGLGLAISQSVVQAHHGEMTVESEQGKGTTFTVTLPSDGRKPVRRIYPRRLQALAASGK